MEEAKQANQIVKKVLERLTDENDIARFSNIPTIFNDAAGMVNGNPINEALLKTWIASEATNAVFLLWRRQIEHADIEEEWRKLPTTDELAAEYNALLEPDKKEADELEARRRAYMDKQHELDIFKAVLNGTPKEDAERQYKEYQEKLAQSMGA